MDSYRALYEIAKQLVLASDPDATAEVVLRELLAIAGADRGFIVVREDGTFRQKLDLRFDRAEVSAEDRRFSRTLVREVIDRRAPLVWDEATRPDERRFPATKSLFQIGAAATLVVPLVERREDGEPGDAIGVIYLDRAHGRGRFPEHVPALVTEIAELAAAFIRRALDRKALSDRARSLEKDLLSQHDFQGIVTRDPAMLSLLRTVAQVASSTASVLVLGETGTGKELIARAIHANSPRRDRPLVTLHCTALPATVLESELFGHVRGAFTGADHDRAGRAASAHGGTLFLDEVAEIPAEAQAKLLRFLQFGEIQRLGSDKVEKVDVRVVAATHRDLERMVEEGRFRQDLYYRLKVVEVELPPLRDRPGDVALLAEAFLSRFSAGRKERPRLSPEARRALESYAFPGNVRELSHLVERAVVLAEGPEIGLADLPREVHQTGSLRPPASGPKSGGAPPASGPKSGSLPPPPRAPDTGDLTGESLDRAREEAVSAIERAFLSRLLERAGGNVSRAAREAGMHRSYLQKLLAKHEGALPPSGRGAAG